MTANIGNELARLSRNALVADLLDEGIEGSVAVVRDGANEGDGRSGRLAHKLAVAREILARDAYATVHDRVWMSRPDQVKEWLRLQLAHREREVFMVLLLDAQNRLISCQEMFVGTLTQTAVYPREVVRIALRENAGALIAVHNHPSGVAEPSRSDELLTAHIKSALTLVDVRLLDHLVVAGTQITSFAERGLL